MALKNKRMTKRLNAMSHVCLVSSYLVPNNLVRAHTHTESDLESHIRNILAYSHLGFSYQSGFPPSLALGYSEVQLLRWSTGGYNGMARSEQKD